MTPMNADLEEKAEPLIVKYRCISKRIVPRQFGESRVPDQIAAYGLLRRD